MQQYGGLQGRLTEFVPENAYVGGTMKRLILNHTFCQS